MKKIAESGKEVKNVGASVRARLLTIAKQTHRDFNAVLLQYFQERFLYRLSISPYNTAFILKGALLLLAHRMSRLRPTKDIDFLGKGVSNAPLNIKKIISEIAAIDSYDAVTFNTKTVHVERITEDADYDGVRVKLEAELSGARSVLQLDIGFGDEIVAGPIQMEFPVLLEMPAPNLYVYSMESSIAEKFQALVKLNVFSSRMKDIYDILFHAESEAFRLDILREAITTTFARRGTALEDRSVVFSEEFSRDPEKQSQWQAFLNRNRLDSFDSFPDVVIRLKDFLEPVCDLQMKSKNVVWDPASWQWKLTPQ